VLSSPKYRKLVERAKHRGFEVRIIFIVLESAELQLERISLRVAEGGHDVPTEKVIGRRQRSFEQLAWFSGEADACYIYDNSTGEPELLASKSGRTLVLWDRLPNDLEATLRSAGVSLLLLYAH
jgi:predicted ABC-type ATPase